MKSRSVVNAGGYPKPSVMSLDDRPADRQAHPHSVRLGREKRIEDALDVLRIDPGAGILHRYQHPFLGTGFGFHPQKPLTRRRRRHRVYGIDRQIQDDLLQLDPIAEDPRELACKLAVNRDALLLQLTLRQLEDLADETIDIDRPDLLVVLFEHGPDRIEYFTGPVAVPDNAFENLPDLVEVGRRLGEPAQTGIGARDHGRQGLLNLVTDRRRHRPHCRELRDARKL